jgi:hypothetical protein
MCESSLEIMTSSRISLSGEESLVSLPRTRLFNLSLETKTYSWLVGKNCAGARSPHNGEGSKLLMTRMHLHQEFQRLTLIDNFTRERLRDNRAKFMTSGICVSIYKAILF